MVCGPCKGLFFTHTRRCPKVAYWVLRAGRTLNLKTHTPDIAPVCSRIPALYFHCQDGRNGRAEIDLDPLCPAPVDGRFAGGAPGVWPTTQSVKPGVLIDAMMTQHRGVCHAEAMAITVVYYLRRGSYHGACDQAGVPQARRGCRWRRRLEGDDEAHGLEAPTGWIDVRILHEGPQAVAHVANPGWRRPLGALPAVPVQVDHLERAVRTER